MFYKLYWIPYENKLKIAYKHDFVFISFSKSLIYLY